jgi:hypothetical protein
MALSKSQYFDPAGTAHGIVLAKCFAQHGDEVELCRGSRRSRAWEKVDMRGGGVCVWTRSVVGHTQRTLDIDPVQVYGRCLLRMVRGISFNIQVYIILVTQRHHVTLFRRGWFMYEHFHGEHNGVKSHELSFPRLGITTPRSCVEMVSPPSYEGWLTRLREAGCRNATNVL